MLTSVIEVIELSKKVVETKHNNAKLFDCINNLEKNLEDVKSIERLVYVNLEVLSGRI